MTPSPAALELARFIEQTYGLVRNLDHYLPVDDEVGHLARLIDEKVGPLRDLAWRYVDLCDKDTDSDLDPWRPASLNDTG